MTANAVKRMLRRIQLSSCAYCGNSAMGAALVAPTKWGFYCPDHQKVAEEKALRIGRRLASARAKFNPTGLYSILK